MLSCFSYTVSTSVCSVDSLSLPSYGKPVTLQSAPKRPRGQDARCRHVKLKNKCESYVQRRARPIEFSIEASRRFATSEMPDVAATRFSTEHMHTPPL